MMFSCNFFFKKSTFWHQIWEIFINKTAIKCRYIMDGTFWHQIWEIFINKTAIKCRYIIDGTFWHFLKLQWHFLALFGPMHGIF